MNPVKSISPPRWMAGRKIRKLMSVLCLDGGAARFVGGSVRDAILRKPAKDIDIAVTHPPEKILQLLRAHKIRAIPTGIEHGTITAVMNRNHYQITTLRRDVSTDGRRAVVSFTDDWSLDAARRDFTMNAIYCSVDGELFDPVGGVADLLNGQIRFIGDAAQRIAEDYLRILRLFRFYGYYGRQPLLADDLAAAKKLAHGIGHLSPERVRDELFKIIASPNPVEILTMMEQNGVLAHVWPGISQFNALRRLVQNAPKSDAELRLIILAFENNTKAKKLAAQFHLSNAQLARIEMAITLGAQNPPSTDADIQKLIYFHSVDALRDTSALWLALEKIGGDVFGQIQSQIIEWRRREFPINGHDVMAVGMAAGPKVGEILTKIESWWVDRGFVPNRAECLQQIRRIAESQ